MLAFVSCSTAPGPVTPTTPIERQMVGLLQKFDRWDEDGDGYLTASELAPTQQVTGRPPENVVKFYDGDGDRRISLKEAQAGLSRFDEVETHGIR